jgi:hypothetical protein
MKLKHLNTYEGCSVCNKMTVKEDFSRADILLDIASRDFIWAKEELLKAQIEYARAKKAWKKTDKLGALKEIARCAVCDADRLK